jgi:hypothetical protein
VERNFIVKLQLGTDFNVLFVTVPIEALVHPLCVIPDIGGDKDIYFVVFSKGDLFKHPAFSEPTCDGQHGYQVPLVSVVKKNICF